MEINRDTQIYISKDGYLVENAYRFSKKNLLFLLRRASAFLIDFSLYGTAQIALYLMISDELSRKLLASIIPIVLAMLYYGFSIMAFQQTFGQKIMRLIITSKDGFIPDKRNLITRVMMSVMFSFAYIGYGLMVLSLITAIWLNGITWLEGISKTNLSNERTHIYLVNLEKSQNSN